MSEHKNQIPVEVQMQEAARMWSYRGEADMMIRSIPERPGVARRGSGIGFHSPEARRARTAQHAENAVRKVSMYDQEQSWTWRLDEPISTATLPFEAEEFIA